MTVSGNDIPMCPLLSIGSGIDMKCSQGKCAWYIPSVKKCSAYMLAYDALLNVNQRQKATK